MSATNKLPSKSSTPIDPYNITVTLDTVRSTDFVQYPFRVIATRLQIAHTWQQIASTVQPMHIPPNMQPTSGINAFNSMRKYESLRSLYQGNITYMLTNAVNAFIHTITGMTAITIAKQSHLTPSTANPPLPIQSPLARSVTTTMPADYVYRYIYGTALLSTVFTYPLTVATTRLAANPALNPMKQQPWYQRLKFFPAIRYTINDAMIVNNEKSIKHLYSGYSVYALRQMLFLAVMQGTLNNIVHISQRIAPYIPYDKILPTAVLSKADTAEQSTNLRTNLTITVIGPLYILSTAATLYPLHVICNAMRVHNMRTAVQLHNQSVVYQAKYYNTVRSAISDIYKTYGIRGFYRGLTTEWFGIAVVITVGKLLT